MKWQFVILALVLVAGCCWLTREAFPKIKYIKPDSDTLLVHDTIPAVPINIDTLPAVLFLKNRLSITKTQSNKWRELYEGVLKDSTVSLSARLDSVIGEDTLRLSYNFPPLNTFSDIHIGIPPYIVESKTITLYVPQYIEKSQFLGGYPEKLLWFLGGYGAGTLLGKRL